MSVASYVIIFIFSFISFCVLSFFQACIFVVVHGRYEGRDLSFSDGINEAAKNSGKLLEWSLIMATVGVILSLISNKTNKSGGGLVARILGAAWNILTYFSLPSLIIGQKPVIESFRESASIIRRTWGETLILYVGVETFFTVLVFLGLVLCGGIALLLSGTPAALIAASVLFVAYALILGVIASTLSSIFKLALYTYATTGQIPQGFSPELIQNAVKIK